MIKPVDPPEVAAKALSLCHASTHKGSDLKCGTVCDFSVRHPNAIRAGTCPFLPLARRAVAAEKNREYITGPALQLIYNHKTYSILERGKRHHDVIAMMREQNVGLSDIGLATQGFATTHRAFVSRREAFKLAKANGQFKRPTPTATSYNGDELYTEDLW